MTDDMTDDMTDGIWTAAPEHAVWVGAAVAEALTTTRSRSGWCLPSSIAAAVLPGYFGAASAQAIKHGTVHVIGDFDAVAVRFDETQGAHAPAEEPDADMLRSYGRYAHNFVTLEGWIYRAAPSARTTTWPSSLCGPACAAPASAVASSSTTTATWRG